jgi:transposase
MEDVLDVYQRPYDPTRPVVCLDEKSKELHGQMRAPLPLKSGKERREDSEYIRNGTAHLFLWVEPLAGRRGVWVTERRTAVDFAEQLRRLVEEDYPHVEQIVLVTDNLNTHSIACLYEAFSPEQAQRIARKIEWHYTPEHGSWLNMAELELSVLGRQCLNRRIADVASLVFEAAAWERERNAASVTINWQFTTSDARVKLRRLYPVVKERKLEI